MIWKQNFFAGAFLVEKRSSREYDNFVDSFIIYQTLFNGAGDLTSILNLPLPLYRDIVVAQIKEKKKDQAMTRKALSTRQVKKQKR